LKDLRIAVAVVGLAATVLSIAAWKPDSAASTLSQEGVDLFLLKGCASCHDGPQTTARVQVAPSLANVAEWAGKRKPGFTATEYLYESIINPPAFISPEFIQTGPTEMPSLNLTDAEINALVAYLLEPQPSSP
jgi:mono/diheme cytochrome c family protein